MAPSSGLHVRAGMGATYPRSYDLHGKMTRARALPPFWRHGKGRTRRHGDGAAAAEDAAPACIDL